MVLLAVGAGAAIGYIVGGNNRSEVENNEVTKVVNTITNSFVRTAANTNTVVANINQQLNVVSKGGLVDCKQGIRILNSSSVDIVNFSELTDNSTVDFTNQLNNSLSSIVKNNVSQETSGIPIGGNTNRIVNNITRNIKNEFENVIDTILKNTSDIQVGLEQNANIDLSGTFLSEGTCVFGNEASLSIVNENMTEGVINALTSNRADNELLIEFDNEVDQVVKGLDPFGFLASAAVIAVVIVLAMIVFRKKPLSQMGPSSTSSSNYTNPQSIKQMNDFLDSKDLTNADPQELFNELQMKNL